MSAPYQESALSSNVLPSNGYELIIWKNKPVTGVVFGAGIVFYAALFLFEYSLLLLVCRVTQLLLIGSILGKFLGRPLPISREAAETTISTVTNRLEVSAKFATALVLPFFSGENLLDSAKAFGAVSVIGIVASFFNTATLLMLIFVGTFTVPFVYNEKRDVIQPILKQGLAVFQQNVAKVLEMIPSANKVKKN